MFKRRRRTLYSPGRLNEQANDIVKAAGKRTGLEDTSSGCSELSPADEPQVSCPSPECLGSVSEAQTGIEMISLKSLTIIDGIVATGGMGAIHPDL